MQWARAILSSVVCPVLQYFSTLSHKRHDFRKKDVEHKMCVSIFCIISCETFFILRRTEREITRNVYWSAGKLPSFPVKSEYNLNSLSIFSKNYQISNFMKIRPVRVEFCIRTDG